MENQKWIRPTLLPYSKAQTLSLSQRKLVAMERLERHTSCHQRWLTSLSLDAISPYYFQNPKVFIMVGTIAETRPVPLLIRLCRLSNQWSIPAWGYPQELHAFLVHMIGHSTCQALHLWGHLTKTRWLSKKALQRRWLSLVTWRCYYATGNPGWSKLPESWRNMCSPEIKDARGSFV